MFVSIVAIVGNMNADSDYVFINYYYYSCFFFFLVVEEMSGPGHRTVNIICGYYQALYSSQQSLHPDWASCFLKGWQASDVEGGCCRQCHQTAGWQMLVAVHCGWTSLFPVLAAWPPRPLVICLSVCLLCHRGYHNNCLLFLAVCFLVGVVFKRYSMIFDLSLYSSELYMCILLFCVYFFFFFPLLLSL